MTYWHLPMPETDGPWQRCVHCGAWSHTTGNKHRDPTCLALRCNLAEDERERQRSMTPAELEVYCRAAEAYFTRPDDPAATQRPLKATRGLTSLSDRERERLSLKRAQDELDEREAKERGL